MDSRSIKCVILGVGEESKAYKLLDPTSKKIIVNRDAVFDEADKWDWTKGKEQEGELVDQGDEGINNDEGLANQNDL